MRADLLDVYAGVEWAESQLKVLEGRIEAWRKFPTHEVIEELNPDRGHKFFKLRNVRPLPSLVNVEAGLIINSLRSSLDVLVNVLAARAGHTHPESTHFPICSDREKFFHGKHAGRKAIRLLSAADQKVIKDLEPWTGGHRHLANLHALDIVRKHRRLVSVHPLRDRLTIGNITADSGFQFVEDWHRFENDAVIGRAKIDAPKPDIEVSFEISLVDGNSFPAVELTRALSEFARATAAIIKLFD